MRKIKKAQNGTLSPYMQKRAAQDKVKAEIIRKKDSISQRGLNASNVGREKKMTMEEYKKKSAEKVAYQGVPKSERSMEQKKEGPNILQKIGSTFTKPHCIFSDENKSGCNSGESAGFKNGGKMKKAQTGDTISKKVVSGPKGSMKTYVTKSGDKKVTGYVAKSPTWERSSRTLKNPSAGENDTIYSKRERGGGKDVKGVERSAEMHDYKVKRPGGVEKGSSYTSTQGGKTTQMAPTKKTFKATKAKSGGGITSKKK